MLFPGSRIWYEGAVADLAALTEEIRVSRFSGHIVLEFPDSPVVVVCKGGSVTTVFEKMGGDFRAAENARAVWDRSRGERGRLTVFELPPRLVPRLRGVRDRRAICSGTGAADCDPLRILRELKRGGFSGILDAASVEGKLLLDLEAGAVVSCCATAAAGPALAGLEAFRSWHEAFVTARAATTFSVTPSGAPGNGQPFDEILMAGAGELSLPLPTSTERLAQRFGRSAAAGETLVAAGSRPGNAISLLSGEVELVPDEPASTARRRLGPGALIGIAWLMDLAPARFGVRASTETRYLVFGREQLSTVFANSPVLAARIVRASAALLARTRTRLEAFRAEPRLHDVETEVIAALGRAPATFPDGLPPADLFRELLRVLPLSPPEIDALFRRLVALGSVAQRDGRIALTLREL